MACHRRKLHFIFFQKALQRLDLFRIPQILGRIQVSLTGITAGTDLQAVNAKAVQVSQRFFQLHLVQHRGHNR